MGTAYAVVFWEEGSSQGNTQYTCRRVSLNPGSHPNPTLLLDSASYATVAAAAAGSAGAEGGAGSDDWEG